MKGNGPPAVPQRRLYAIKEAAVYMGFSPWTVRDMIWAGEIPYIKRGAKYFLDIADIDRWIEKSKTRFTY